MIKTSATPNFEYRMREKCKRWNLKGVEAITGATIIKRLKLLQTRVAPKVSSAVLSTLFNRWCTPRRFQNRSSPLNRCLLGCPPLAEDSIEHYAHCKCIRQAAIRFLAIPASCEINMQHFMLASDTLKDADILVCTAILIYAAYTATNIVRERGAAPLEENDAFELVKQCCRNGVKGHGDCMKLLDGRWPNADSSRRRTAHATLRDHSSDE